MKENRLQGTPVSEGIAIGPAFFLSHQQQDAELVPEVEIDLSEVDREIARWRRALFSSREDLRLLQSNLKQEGSFDAATIIDSHIQMLADPLITTNIEDKIRNRQKNTESVFRAVITDYEKKLTQSRDSFFEQRLIDVRDVSKRILNHLAHHPQKFFENIPADSIVFTHELVPSHTATVHPSQVSGFVIHFGGGHSHAALIARAKRIPCVASIDMHLMQQAEGKQVIIDGTRGEVILNPTESTLLEYQEKREIWQASYQLLKKEVLEKTETVEGYSVEIHGNIGSVDEMELLHQMKGDGVGLFRSEYLLLEDPLLLESEEGQYQAYQSLLQQANDLPVVIRVFDIGGDKSPALLSHEIGRGIQFLLHRKPLFKIQLRAILRAAFQKNVRILLPLIADIQELRETKLLLTQVADELRREKVPYASRVPLGCMVEVPAAVYICDALAEESDFLSIGTNDLVQYTLGIDRRDPLMNDFCFPTHPSIPRMIKLVADAARLHKKPLMICGELASNPLFIPLLLGLGIEAFSCAPRYIPFVKKTIHQSSFEEALLLAEQVLPLNCSADVGRTILKFAEGKGHATT